MLIRTKQQTYATDDAAALMLTLRKTRLHCQIFFTNPSNFVFKRWIKLNSVNDCSKQTFEVKSNFEESLKDSVVSNFV